MTQLYEQYFSKSEYLAEFETFLSTVEFSDRNPLNTEMFFLWSMIRATKPKLFIESGTFRGYSATFICEALQRNNNESRFVTYGFNLENCIPFARERLRQYPFAEVVEGDSRKLIGRLKTSDPVAFFIDGPKGSNMPPLFYAIEENFKNIEFIAVHDCEKESGSRNRWYVEQFFGLRYETMYCDKEFQLEFAYLDEPLIDRSELAPWRPFYMHGQTIDSYGSETGYVLPKRIKQGLLRQIHATWYRFYRFKLIEYVAWAIGRRKGWS